MNIVAKTNKKENFQYHSKNLCFTVAFESKKKILRKLMFAAITLLNGKRKPTQKTIYTSKTACTIAVKF